MKKHKNILVPFFILVFVGMYFTLNKGSISRSFTEAGLISMSNVSQAIATIREENRFPYATPKPGFADAWGDILEKNLQDKYGVQQDNSAKINFTFEAIRFFCSDFFKKNDSLFYQICWNPDLVNIRQGLNSQYYTISSVLVLSSDKAISRVADKSFFDLQNREGVLFKLDAMRQVVIPHEIVRLKNRKLLPIWVNEKGDFFSKQEEADFLLYIKEKYSAFVDHNKIKDVLNDIENVNEKFRDGILE